MKIGSFGTLIFEVSSSIIKTFNDFERSRSANFAEINLLNRKPQLQFTGNSLDTISFNMYISSNLGVEPKLEMALLEKTLKSGKEKNLIIGEQVLGKYVLTNISESWDIIGGGGKLVAVAIKVSLKEYIGVDK